MVCKNVFDRCVPRENYLFLEEIKTVVTEIKHRGLNMTMCILKEVE
jgi:hypothetical protein